MPMIKVELFAGRTADQKAELARELTSTYVRVMGGKPEAVSIIFSDVDKSDWANAGVMMSEKYPD